MYILFNSILFIRTPKMKVYKNEKNVRQKKTLCDLNLLFFASQDMNQSMLAYPTNPTNFKKKK